MIKLIKHIFIPLLFCCVLSFGQVGASNKTITDSTATQSSSDSLTIMFPGFPGGLNAMNQFLNENLEYPESFKKSGIGGTCYVKFTVTAEGKLEDIHILKGIPGCIECDIEGVRLVSLMPNWEPALKNGKPVKTFFSLPIKFGIK